MKWYVFLFIVLVGCAGKASLLSPSVSFGDVVDAAKGGSPVVCVTEIGAQTSTVYLLGDLFRMDTLPANAHVIYFGDKMYSWNGGAGTVISLSGQSRKSAEEIVLGSRKSGTVCDIGVFGRDMFVPPSNIQFNEIKLQ